MEKSITKSKTGFPHSSVGKESACNAGDPSLIPGIGRSAGEGIGYPLQYSWVSLVAQLVKNPSAMWETWVQSLGREDYLGERKGYPLQYSGLENSMDCMVHGVAKSWTWLSDLHFHFQEQNMCVFIYDGVLKEEETEPQAKVSKGMSDMMPGFVQGCLLPHTGLTWAWPLDFRELPSEETTLVRDHSLCQIFL